MQPDFQPTNLQAALADALTGVVGGVLTIASFAFLALVAWQIVGPWLLSRSERRDSRFATRTRV